MYCLLDVKERRLLASDREAKRAVHVPVGGAKRQDASIMTGFPKGQALWPPEAFLAALGAAVSKGAVCYDRPGRRPSAKKASTSSLTVSLPQKLPAAMRSRRASRSFSNAGSRSGVSRRMSAMRP